MIKCIYVLIEVSTYYTTEIILIIFFSIPATTNIILTGNSLRYHFISEVIYIPIEVSASIRSRDKQTSPISFMFGCQMRVLHDTLGGYKKIIICSNIMSMQNQLQNCKW